MICLSGGTLKRRFHCLLPSGVCILSENDIGFMDDLDNYPDCPDFETSEKIGCNQ
jgi:hypothetical protein